MKSQRNHILRANRAPGIRLTRWVGLAILALALNAVPAIHVNAETVTDDNAAAKIEGAKTKPEHQALEAYFTVKAAEAAKQVRLHEDMMRSYKKWGKISGSAIWLRNHCKGLLRTYRELQADYESMAELHGWMAEELSKE